MSMHNIIIDDLGKEFSTSYIYYLYINVNGISFERRFNDADNLLKVAKTMPDMISSIQACDFVSNEIIKSYNKFEIPLFIADFCDDI